jgi:hypothetical protein
MVSGKPTREQLFWARELVQLARKQAVSKGVPDHVMAQAMLVQAFMLFTGQSEEDSSQAVRDLYVHSMAKRFPNAVSEAAAAAV